MTTLAKTIKKVLVVDDSETERESLRGMLSSRGYEVVTAKDAQDAFAQMERVRPDLVLMDVVMPGQNGFQATRAIASSEQYSDIPVIMCTSKSQETDRVWGMRQGARDYVTKPVNAEELISKIQAIAAGDVAKP